MHWKYDFRIYTQNRTTIISILLVHNYSKYISPFHPPSGRPRGRVRASGVFEEAAPLCGDQDKKRRRWLDTAGVCEPGKNVEIHLQATKLGI
jgi:hypothetical protein